MSVTRMLKNKLMLAPLAGYTDVGFRQLCAMHGCGIVVTEMISAMALKQGNRITLEMLADRFCGTGDTVRSVQLFGSNADIFAEVVQHDEIQKFDVIDINMGCPMSKVVKNGEGATLMLNPDNAAKIIRAAVKYGKKPVSVKFRKGYCTETAADFAKMCEDSGAAFLTIHGRTQEQMYRGKADWDAIKRAVKAVSMPVFANGDIFTKQDVDAVLNQTEAYGAAIGRGALGCPQLFADISGVKTGMSKLQIIEFHINALLEVFRPDIVQNEMKKHYVRYLKGLRDSKPALAALMASKSVDAQLNILHSFAPLWSDIKSD